ncbi:IclR family transcriptional regulator [Noviherbaspirillum sp. Root189]|uniref:IclR family transcriptional regulator n=1 Tax=Noviherbaspirillum sp. Root189 TaxID=1736487 RepID=UPI00070ADBFE|nr:IclR family transcriptional regulator [Noviherbaspirillum sp. Root189]KRB86974.1 hypothetical protein ASE07_20410 [Noviherbaspirillum sp. Root189]
MSTGTQSLDRALSLLSLIEQSHQEGIELAGLVEKSELDRTTVYRLVSALVQAGFVERDSTTKKYRLGVEAMQIGLMAMSRAPIVESCKPLMQLLARETEDTVFLVVRNGDYAHCLHIEQGSFPVKAITQHVGGLRILGLGTAGQALLATMGDAEIEAIYIRHREEYESHGLNLRELKQAVKNIRANGHAVTVDIITEGVCGVGVAFEITKGNYAGVSIAGIGSRFPAARCREIASLIGAQLRSIGFRSFGGK